MEVEKMIKKAESNLMKPDKAVKIIDENIELLRAKYYKRNKNKNLHRIVGDIVMLFHEFMWANIQVFHGNMIIDNHLSLHFMGHFTLFYDDDYVTEWHWSKATHVIKSDKYSHLQNQYNKRGVK